MEEKSSLEKDIWEIWQILLSAKSAYQYCKYFYAPKTASEITFVRSSIHIQTIRESLLKIVIIELHKLFSNSSNDHYNFQRLIRNFDNNGIYKKLNVPDTTLKKWRSLLKTHKGSVQKIKLLRNKLYAHTDRNKQGAQAIILSFKDIEALIKLAELIIQDVHSIIFESDTIFDIPHFNADTFDMLKILAESEAKRRDEIKNAFLKNRG